jgi:hypothetical protein
MVDWPIEEGDASFGTRSGVSQEVPVQLEMEKAFTAGLPANRQVLELAGENSVPSSLDAHGRRGRSRQSRGSLRRIFS